MKQRQHRLALLSWKKVDRQTGDSQPCEKSVLMPSVGKERPVARTESAFICVLGLRICAGDSRFASLLFHRWSRGKNLEPIKICPFVGFKICGTPTLSANATSFCCADPISHGKVMVPWILEQRQWHQQRNVRTLQAFQMPQLHLARLFLDALCLILLGRRSSLLI